MAETAKTKKEYNSDLIHCSLSDGTNEFLMDIQADANPLLAHGAHTTEKFRSQFINAQSVTLDGGYEATSLTIVYDEEEYAQVEEWWKAGTRLTYTVVGLTTAERTYNDCIVRISATPAVVPGKTDYKVYTIEITSLENIAETETATA